MPLPKNPKTNLRSKYKKVMLLSLIISLSLLILSFQYFPKVADAKIKLQSMESPIIVEIIPTKINKTPPPLPKPPIPVEDLSLELEEIIFEENILNIDESVNPLPPPVIERITKEIEEEIFIVVEELPAPLGGMQSLIKNIVYPEISKRAGIEGTVIVEAVINKNGDVIDAVIFLSASPGLDTAALTAVKKTKFTPGKQRGKPVMVRMKIPIKFKLN